MTAGGRAGPSATATVSSPHRGGGACRPRGTGRRGPPAAAFASEDPHRGRVCKRPTLPAATAGPWVPAAPSMAPDGVFHPAARPMHEPATMRRRPTLRGARAGSQLQAAAGRKRNRRRCGRAGGLGHRTSAVSSTGGPAGVEKQCDCTPCDRDIIPATATPARCSRGLGEMEGWRGEREDMEQRLLEARSDWRGTTGRQGSLVWSQTIGRWQVQSVRVANDSRKWGPVRLGGAAAHADWVDRGGMLPGAASGGRHPSVNTRSLSASSGRAASRPTTR